MSDRDDGAVSVAKVINYELDDDLAYPLVVVRCPYCDSRHRHGAPDDDDDGIRASHCHNGEYRIERRTAADTKVNVLYRFFSEGGELLYVGITRNPFQRFKAHQQEKNWFNEIVTATMEHFASRGELAAAEIVAIQTEKPRYNKAHTAVTPPPPPVRLHARGQAASVFGNDANRFDPDPPLTGEDRPRYRLWETMPCPSCLTLGRVFQPADENWKPTTGERTCLACGDHWTHKQWSLATTGIAW